MTLRHYLREKSMHSFGNYQVSRTKILLRTLTDRVSFIIVRTHHDGDNLVSGYTLHYTMAWVISCLSLRVLWTLHRSLTNCELGGKWLPRSIIIPWLDHSLLFNTWCYWKSWNSYVAVENKNIKRADNKIMFHINERLGCENVYNRW